MPDSSTLCCFSRGMYFTAASQTRFHQWHNHQFPTAACIITKWMPPHALYLIEWFWTKHVCHWLKMKQTSRWWEGHILPHFSVPTWALNLQTVSCDHYLSHEKICTTPSGNERKQKDLRIIYFSIIITLLKSDKCIWDVQQMGAGSGMTMWNFLYVITIRTHFKAALSNLCTMSVTKQICKKIVAAFKNSHCLDQGFQAFPFNSMGWPKHRTSRIYVTFVLQTLLRHSVWTIVVANNLLVLIQCYLCIVYYIIFIFN